MDKNQDKKENLTAFLQNEIEEIYSNPYTKLSSNILKIKSLLNKGADINSQDKNGNTLLHHIVSSQKIKMYNAYTKENLCVNPQTKTQYLLDLSSILSTHLPNPFLKNNEGKTPLDLALEKKSKADIKILTSYENAYSSFLHDKQINLISYNQSPYFILNLKHQQISRQKD